MEQQAQQSIDGGNDGAKSAQLTPGAALKSAREARGLSPEQLCEAIQLERRLLDALESDRFEAFDAPVFARGFLRKSAAFLGLDPVEILAGYDRLHRGPEAPTHIPPTTRITPRRVSPWRLPLLGLGGLLAVGGAVWWLVAGLGGVGSSTPSATETVLPMVDEPGLAAPAAAVAELPGAAEAPAAPVAGPVAGDTPLPADAGADLAAPAPGVGASPTQAAPQVPVQSPVQSPAPVPGQPPTAAPPSRATLQFQFTGSSWLNVVGPDGRRLYFGMASPGVLPFAGPGPWQVLVGDARQVRVSLGGRDLMLPRPAPGENMIRFTVTADGQVR